MPDGQMERESAVHPLQFDHTRFAERTDQLRSSVITVIQLSVLGLVTGVAAYRALPISVALVPPLANVWVFYMFSMDRETKINLSYYAWTERELNKYYGLTYLVRKIPQQTQTEQPNGPDSESWQMPQGDALLRVMSAVSRKLLRTKEPPNDSHPLGVYLSQTVVAKTASTVSAPMLYGIYLLSAMFFVGGWVFATFTIYEQLGQRFPSAHFLHNNPGLIAALYAIIGLIMGGISVFSYLSNRNLRVALDTQLATVEVVPKTLSADGAAT